MSLSIISIVAPAFMFTSGMLLGTAFSRAPTKAQRIKIMLVGGFAVIIAVALLLLVWLYPTRFTSIYTFENFSTMVGSLLYVNTTNSIPFMTTAILVGIFEAGLASGFSIATKLSPKDIGESQVNSPQSSALSSKKAPAMTMNVANASGAAKATSVAVVTEPISEVINPKDTTEIAEGQGLHRDEQGIMELFLYGKVTEIKSVADITKPGGYYLKGIPQLGWETKRLREVLDSLVRKGFLKAELTDKIIICKTCGSANVRLKKICPDCRSLKLRKAGLIEHFSCGAVERQEAFETATGDLICPKCKAKLQLIGSDYRKLPPAYQCLECNTLSTEPLLIAKCRDCETAVDMGEEPEVFLYSYTVNPGLPIKEMQQIKPLEACANFFKSLGYAIVTPALVSGKSGTQHLFDILVLGKVGWTDDQGTSGALIMRKDNGNTVVQLLISSKPVDIEEITRMYGMINDVDCDAITFVLPALTDSARNYATAYDMKVSEGQTIEEALAKSKISPVGSKVGN